MEIREFAERVLFSRSLQDKLAAPGALTDRAPGPPLRTPDQPGRPAELLFHSGRAKFQFPSLQRLDDETQRARLLHFFANHELLATELMALVLLKFPDAPKAFRSGVLQTLKEEQTHTRLYLRRLEALGARFGEYPVNGFFWRMIADVPSPMDYVSRLSLTFEQANLDYAKFYADQFRIIGDEPSRRLMERIYEDEIGHVAYGLKWFRKWKSPEQSDWEAFTRQLQLPQSAGRAKAEPFNREGRRRAGLTDDFIDELFVYSRSKGRAPGVFLFNPFAESRMGRAGFEPNQRQAALARDLENLPQFLCRRDDVVLVHRRPSTAFLAALKRAGFELPEFVETRDGCLTGELTRRKIGALKPWAWSLDSIELLRPLVKQLAAPAPPMDEEWVERIRPLYSKAWGADRLRELISGQEWMCPPAHVGVLATTAPEAIDAIERIRAGGHQRVVAKMLFGVAGANMLRLWEPELSEDQRTWIERTIRGEGGVVIEPWLERVFDFSFQFEMTADGLRPVGMVEMINDRRGQYQASVHQPRLGAGGDPELLRLLNGPRGGRLRKLQSALATLLEPRLRAAGFTGPIGVDAFAYRDGDALRVKPITEINPRYTMGRLMIELMRHAASGRVGTLELVTRPALRRRGCGAFGEYARRLAAEQPVRLSGQPKARIDEGAVCLNDPDTATACLAVFTVSRSRGAAP